MQCSVCVFFFFFPMALFIDSLLEIKVGLLLGQNAQHAHVLQPSVITEAMSGGFLCFTLEGFSL